MKINQKIESFLPYFLFVSAIFTGNIVHSQIKNGADLYITDDSVLYVNAETFDFGSGTIITSRTKLHYGVLSMSDGSSWAGASMSSFVDGYVQTHSTSAFVLPVGQYDVYAPIQVTPSTSEGLDAAYFRTPPTSISSVIDESLSSLSSVEYWDINSTGSNAVISLSWRSSSAISDLTSSSLENLTIVGYNGFAWVTIPSIVDEYSILGEISNLGHGSISSNKEIDLSSYSAFSLGITKKALIKTPEDSEVELTVYATKNRLFIEASRPITALIIYDIRGRKIFSDHLYGGLKYDLPFNYAEDIYILKIELGEGTSLFTKKIINRS